MCRLLGIIANKPVDLRFSLVEGPKTIMSMSCWNPDGWGLGWYGDDGIPVIVKEPRQASESKLYHRTAAEGRSRIFVAHVRRATTGTTLSYENCHPFAEGSWIFAHNGSIKNYESLIECLTEPHREAIMGQTDSEILFHWILQNIEACGSVIDGVKAAIRKIQSYTALNFLLSDGKRLYAYRDATTCTDYYTLYWLVRYPSAPGPLEVRSTEVRVLLESKALRGERAVLVCSERLTDEAWKETPLGNLLVADEALEPKLVEVR